MDEQIAHAFREWAQAEEAALASEEQELDARRRRWERRRRVLRAKRQRFTKFMAACRKIDEEEGIEGDSPEVPEPAHVSEAA